MSETPTPPTKEEVASALRLLAASHGHHGHPELVGQLKHWAKLIEEGDSQLWGLFVRCPLALRFHQLEQRGTLASIQDELERAFSNGLQRERVYDHIDANAQGLDYAEARMAMLSGDS